MRYLILSSVFCLLISCGEHQEKVPFSSVEIESLYTDSVSIRAIEFLDKNTLAFAGRNGIYGSIELNSAVVRTNVQEYDTLLPEYRAVGHTKNDFFMLSVGNPALLYKTGLGGTMELVYKEEGKGVFYDALRFWNDDEGIAIGDSTADCLAMLITRDGGETWNKLSCNELPVAPEGEGAFAASNTNIETIGNTTWVATTSGTVYFSPDKGKSWEVYTTPIVNKEATQGIYAIDFYDEMLGIAIGGDFTKPESNHANKALTIDGGKHWTILAEGKAPGYKSCVQFVPNSEGKEMVALGFTGISYSGNRGEDWKTLSKESFYTIQFLNDSIAYAAGKNRIAKLTFR